MEKKFLNQSKPDPVREYEREERIRKWSEKQRREEEKEPKTKEISQETAEAIVELLLTSTKNLLTVYATATSILYGLGTGFFNSAVLSYTGIIS